MGGSQDGLRHDSIRDDHTRDLSSDAAAALAASNEASSMDIFDWQLARLGLPPFPVAKPDDRS